MMVAKTIHRLLSQEISPPLEPILIITTDRTNDQL